MKRFRTLLTLLLVALWPLATVHCDLEQIPGLAFLACADGSATGHQDNDCETDNCASIESGFYKTEDAQQVVPAPQLVGSELIAALMAATENPLKDGKIAFATAPPELPKSWQFCFRTALSPRAPSFVS